MNQDINIVLILNQGLLVTLKGNSFYEKTNFQPHWWSKSEQFHSNTARDLNDDNTTLAKGRLENSWGLYPSQGEKPSSTMLLKLEVLMSHQRSVLKCGF